MMANPVTTDPARLVASLTDWWALAGFDTAIEEAPRNWLNGGRPAAPQALPTPDRQDSDAGAAAQPSPLDPPVPSPEIVVPMPDDLDAFMAWLADDPSQPETAFSSTRILPQIVARPDLLVITDMPTQEDMAAGRLFSSDDGALLNGILRVLGIDRERTSLASLLLARPTGGVMDDALANRATSRLHHFVELIAPRAVILLGDRTSRAFEKADGGKDSLPTHAINLDDGILSAMSLPAPFVLLKHPERKAAAWAHLRHMAKR